MRFGFRKSRSAAQASLSCGPRAATSTCAAGSMRSTASPEVTSRRVRVTVLIATIPTIPTTIFLVNILLLLLLLLVAINILLLILLLLLFLSKTLGLGQ